MATNPAYPFLEMDITKVMSSFKMPVVNVKAVMASHQKNVDAITNASQHAFEGVQEIAKRQGEMIRQGVDDITGTAKNAKALDSLEETAVIGAETFKTLYQSALANTWDLNDMASKTTSKSLGIINKRVAESLDEVKDYFAKPDSTPAQTTTAS